MNRFDKLLRIAVILIALAAAPCISDSSWGGSETLYVFYPLSATTASVEKRIKSACPGIEITVFGRFKDFEDGVISHAPDAVLTKPAVIEQVGGYDIRLNGIRKGNTEESYIFLSVDRAIDVSGTFPNLAGKTIGVFDILGRKGMDRFIGKFLNPVPELQRVSKIEDLLQLLTYNMVEGILIPETDAELYKKISNLNFVVTPFPNMKAGILALGVKTGKEAALTVKVLTALNEQNMSLLEVDKWK
jgi:hypothetical protein